MSLEKNEKMDPETDRKSENQATKAPVRESTNHSQFNEAEYARWSENLRKSRRSK